MIEVEKTVLDSTAGCDGRCEVRLLQTLQKAIGDILSDHARGLAADAGPSLQARALEAGSKMEVENKMRPTNGSGLGAVEQAESGMRASQPAADPAVAVLSRAEVATLVVDTIAEITRYPREILTPEARFDDDLGIDSLKRAEIVTALLNRFGDTTSDLKALGPMPLTVGEMTDFASAYFRKSAGTATSAAPVRSEGNDLRDAVDSPSAPPLSRPAQPQRAPELPQPVSFWARQSFSGGLFEGRVALVTGSGGGVGSFIAKQLAELGAHVITSSPHSAEVAAGQVTHLRSSLASSEDVDRVFRAIEERFDSLDYYVHNAADEVITSLDRATENDWEKVFRTDIVGYHLAALRAAKLMKKSGGGRIVALSSPGARRYIEHYGVMGPVKAALESLTMYLAQELAAYNIQVNSVSAPPTYGEQQLVSVEEAADAVIFLLSGAARKVNGSTMVVDGGWSGRI